MWDVYTYAGTGRQLWLGCAPYCPPQRYWPRLRCPSFVSWYEHDLDDKGESKRREGREAVGELNPLESLAYVHPNPGQRCWRRKSLGRQNEEDLDERIGPPLKTHRRETDKPGSIIICK